MHHSKTARLLVLVVLLLPGAPGVQASFDPPHASPPPPLAHSTPEGLLSFADALRANGEGYRAATEYMRVLYHYSDDDALYQRAVRGLGASYAQAGRWEDAAFRYRALYERFPSAQARHQLGGALYRAGRNGEAAKVLLFPTEAYQPGPAQRTLGTLAWLKMRPRAGEGENARGPDGVDPAPVEDYDNLTLKNPTTAGMLSAVLPGSGHLYVGRKRDAAVAFVLNGLFIWGTVSAIQDEEWTLAAVLGGAEIFWYTGTIAGSVNATHKWNRREKERFFRKWEAGAMPRWALWRGDDSWGIALGGGW